MARIAWQSALVVLLAGGVSAGGPNRRPLERPVAVGLRVVSSDPKAVQIELTNGSGKPIDSEVVMQVMLKRLDDRKGPEHASVIYTWVDPSTGVYRLPVPGEASARLLLAVGEARTITVEFSKFKWSYPALGNRTPEGLRDLAESGDFDLNTSLSLKNRTSRASFAGPVRIHIVVR